MKITLVDSDSNTSIATYSIDSYQELNDFIEYIKGSKKFTIATDDVVSYRYRHYQVLTDLGDVQTTIIYLSEIHYDV